ncbi:MAG: hypothetical protein KIG88_02205, partial [Weeksellaceae bacterium]|nr:hypothetical protein [Weeksellaceae bacterium]
FTRIVQKLCKKCKINDFFLFGDWIKNILNYKTVIVFAPVEDKILKYIKSKNPNIKIIYWFWNPAYRIGRPTPLHYEVSELWNFDKENAIQYKMHYNNTFYFDSIKATSDTQEKINDIVFVGRNKHRNETLLNIKTQFDNLGLVSLFHIVPNRNENNPDNIKELSYQEYINLITNSKAILDVMPPSQIGLTLRPMESLFLEIKLITNNVHIKNEPFYNKNNIFIIGDDNFEDLKSFLESPYQKIPDKIKMDYEFDQWITRILTNKKEEN